MIDLSSALPMISPAVAPPPTVPVAVDYATPAGSFGETLDAFLDARDPAPEAPVVPVPVPARQEAADPGKNLPASEDDEAPDSAAIPLWFAPVPLARRSDCRDP